MSNPNPPKIRGIFPALLTAFDASGDVKPKEVRRHLDFLIERGVHGVFTLGTNGEFALLTSEEKREIIQTVVEHVDRRVPVITGVGHPSTRETVELARFAAKAGVDALSVIIPYYYPCSREGLMAHYRAVAEAVDLPILIYHIPHRTGSWLTTEVLAELAEIPSIRGIKDSSRDLTWFYQALQTAPSLTLLMGTEPLIYSGLLLGAAGAVSAVANVFPEIVVDIYRAVTSHDLEQAKKAQDQVLRIRETFKAFPYMSGLKAAAELRGIAVGPPRLPLRGLDAEGKERLRKELKEFL